MTTNVVCQAQREPVISFFSEKVTNYFSSCKKKKKKNALNPLLISFVMDCYG